VGFGSSTVSGVSLSVAGGADEFSLLFAETSFAAGLDLEAVSCVHPMEMRDHIATTTRSVLREPVDLESRWLRLRDRHRFAGVRDCFSMFFNPHECLKQLINRKMSVGNLDFTTGNPLLTRQLDTWNAKLSVLSCANCLHPS